MAIDIVNASDADITGFGGSGVNIPKRSYVAGAAMTDAQAVAGVQANARTAAIKNGSPNSDSAQIAGAILDAQLTYIDLTTPAARELNRQKRGQEEGQRLSDLISQP